MKMNKYGKYFIVTVHDEDLELLSEPQASENSEGEKGKVEEEDWTIFCRIIDRSLTVIMALCYAFYKGN